MIVLIVGILGLYLSACDNSTNNSDTNSSSNNTADNGASITWDNVQADSLLSITNNNLAIRHIYWSGNVLMKSDRNVPYHIVGDTLFYNNYDKYIRTQGSTGSAIGKWRYLFLGTGDTDITNHFTVEQRRRFDSLTAIGKNYAKIGGGVTEIEITTKNLYERNYYGDKPAFMSMAEEYSPYYCSNGFEPASMYCRLIVSGRDLIYTPTLQSDFAIARLYIKKNETVTFTYASRKNEMYMSGYFVPGTYTSSNPNHAPLVMIDGDNYNLRSGTWIDSLYMSLNSN